MKRCLPLLALLGILLMHGACADVPAYGEVMQWVADFGASLGGLEVRNRPERTLDPSRADGLLYQYDFGLVRAKGDDSPRTDAVSEIILRTPDVVDPRDAYVGMAPEEAGLTLPERDAWTDLYVTEVSEEDEGYCWLYGDPGTPGAAEWTALGTGGETVPYYRLTYAFDTQERIAEIRLKFGSLTPEEARNVLEVGRELMRRQQADGAGSEEGGTGDE